MKTIALWIIGCLVLTAIGCTERTDKRTELPLNRIDTAKLRPELKAVVRTYIKVHRQYKTFLMVQGKVQEEEWFDYKTPYYFCIGPALEQLFDGGEFTLGTSYPTSYFLLNGRTILVKTLQEEFVVPDKAVIDTYNRLAEPLDTFEKGTPYTELRIYSNRQQGDKITFKCYNHVTHEIIPMSQAITFDGQAHGNLSSLFELSAISDNL